MLVNKSDQQLIDQMVHMFSEIIPEDMSNKEVAGHLEVSEDKVKELWKIINVNYPKDAAPF